MSKIINKIQECRKIYERAFKKAFADHEASGEKLNITELIDHYVKLEIKTLDRAIEVVGPKLDEVIEKHFPKDTVPTKLTDKWTTITIRPEIIPNIMEFKSDIDELLTSPKFIEWEYCFEQKGEFEENMGAGAHAHILVKIKGYIKGRKDLLEPLQHIIKKYKCQPQIGQYKGPMLIKDDIGLDRFRNYIRGNKHNKDKEAACNIDKIWRKKLNIEDIYMSHTIKTDVAQ